MDEEGGKISTALPKSEMPEPILGQTKRREKMSKVCLNRGCKKEPVYCSKCYEEISSERYFFKKKLSNRNHLLLTIPFLIILSGMIPYFFMNVNEQAFCQEKVSKYFPEYQFNEVSQYGSNLCVGEYAEKGEVRDGLKVVSGSVDDEKVLYLELIDSKDLEYIHRDDDIGSWAFVAFTIGVLGLCFVINDWLE